MKKKVLAILIVAVMLIALIPTTALAHGGNHDVHYHKNDWNGIRVRVEAGTGGTIYSPNWQNVPGHNETWTFTAVPDTGYEFDHWTYNGNEVSGAFSSSDEDLSVTFIQRGSWVSTGFLSGYWDYAEYRAQAVFEYVGLPTYDVTLDLGAGGTFNSNGLSTITLNGEEGQTVNVPPYTLNSGYQYDGWDGSLVFDGNKTLHMQYEYLITFAGNTHITITGTNPVWTSNHNATAPSYSVDSGYRFDGWDRSLNSFTAPTTVTANPAVQQATLTVSSTDDGTLLDEGAVEGTYDVGDTVDLDNANPHPDFRFIGWRKDSTGDMISGSVVTIAAGNNAYTAVFGKYLGTSAGDHGFLDNDLDGYYERNTTVNLDTAQPTGDSGYTLDCWREFDGTQWEEYDGFGRVVQLNGSGEPIITIGGQNIFRAFFKVANYSISYDLAGGSVSTVNPSSYTYFDSAFTLNNPTKTGYTFTGWTGTGLSGSAMTVTIPHGSTGDRSYTATWTANTYTVVYNSNGGDGGSTSSSSHTYDALKNLTANGFTRTGCTFLGWATSSTGAVVYGDEESVVNLTDVNGATIDLYAKWALTGITVTGFDGEYDASPHSVTVTGTLPGDTVTYSLNGIDYSSTKPSYTNVTPSAGITIYVKVERAGTVEYTGSDVVKITRADATITPNNKSKTYGGTDPALDATVTGTVNGETLDYSLSRVAGEDAGDYDINVTLGSGSVNDNYDITTDKGTFTINKAMLTVTADDKDIIYNDPAPDYTVTYSGFVGTDDVAVLTGDPSLTCPYNQGDDIGAYIITAGTGTLSATNYDFNPVNGTLTVATMYLDVTFEDYDGNVLGTDRVPYGGDATPPADPAREGYTFTGWDVPYDPITADTTVTALYEINTYTVTFVDHDGTILDTQTVDWETAATAPADPEREGYTFTGWDVPFDVITSNTTVTAQYEPVEVIEDETLPGGDTEKVGDEDVPQTGASGFVWWWIPVVVGAALLLFFIIFFWKRKKQQEQA